ncbi:MAG: hypothetical protein R2720_08240 [Candidatus Nanopelagicales bacterium]
MRTRNRLYVGVAGLAVATIGLTGCNNPSPEPSDSPSSMMSDDAMSESPDAMMSDDAMSESPDAMMSDDAMSESPDAMMSDDAMDSDQ